MQLRPARFVFALTLASVITAAPVLLLAITGRPWDKASPLPFAAAVLGTNWLLWLAGMTVLAWAQSRWVKVPGFAFRVLGAILGFLFMPTIGAASNSVWPLFLSAQSLPHPDLIGILESGVVLIPLGWLGGWMVEPRTTPAETDAAAPPLHRSWRDLRKLRVSGGLAAASAPWLLAGGVGAILTGGGPDFKIPTVVAETILLEIWYLVLGFLYLFVVTRWRPQIHRRDCLLLGTLLTCLLPISVGVIVTVFSSNAAGMDKLARQQLAGILDVILFGVATIPLGLLSGWIFWRVGVRPAAPSDLAPVFD